MAYGEGSITPVTGKRGSYRIRVVHPITGRQVMRTVHGVASTRAAEKEATKFKKQLEAAAAGGPVLPTNPSVEEFLAYWLEQKKSKWSPNTYRGYVDKLKKVRRDLGKDKLVRLDGQPGARLLDEWYAKCQKNGASEAEIFHTNRVLSSALHQAERWGMIERSATDLTDPPSYEPPPVQAIEPEQMQEFIDACLGRRCPYLAVAVVLSSSTGLRRGELCAARWSDFDPAKAQLMVDSAVKYDLDWDDAGTSGRRSRRVLDGPTKTKRQRPLSLHPMMVLILQAWRTEVKRASVAAGVAFNPDGYIFTPDPTGTRPYKPDSYSQAVRRVNYKPCPTCGFKWKRNRDPDCDICQGDGRIRIFDMNLLDMRHFHGTHAVGEGVDLRTVAGRHGSDIKVIMKHYAAFLPRKDEVAARAIGDLILPAMSALPMGQAAS
jgi:integrase